MTSVPPETASNVAVRVISPEKAGSVVNEIDGFDDPARRRQLYETHIDHVFPVCRLAAKSALTRRVEQRHPVSAPDPRVELMNFAGHLGGRKPVDERLRIEEGRVKLLGSGPDDPRCAGRGASMLVGHIEPPAGAS
jgi:hypothetical protein